MFCCRTFQNPSFRFRSRQDAFIECEKADDCGGISRNNDGTWECRAWEFVDEVGAISYAKPKQVFTDFDYDK